jgi:hypothetical protein
LAGIRQGINAVSEEQRIEQLITALHDSDWQTGKQAAGEMATRGQGAVAALVSVLREYTT